jgi:hypothetical protein
MIGSIDVLDEALSRLKAICTKYDSSQQHATITYESPMVNEKSKPAPNLVSHTAEPNNRAYEETIDVVPRSLWSDFVRWIKHRF